ncbi:flagellar protein FlgN [Novosphingobium sp. FKTRR1]|uniref:flagellar protein FlgN n=1 Tax=unclassified Novosphingobium TaxID=2644732 RepID=UPI001CEFD843|nr:flagellar protein FlgN [Novosphingobium sp. FKTRR1]
MAAAVALVPIAEVTDLRDTLRHMLAVLEDERHALAGLDVNRILGCAADKNALCGRLDTTASALVDEECRGLLDAARRLNEANRRVRNLIAANVSARLDAMTGQPALYRTHATTARIGRRR